MKNSTKAYIFLGLLIVILVIGFFFRMRAQAPSIEPLRDESVPVENKEIQKTEPMSTPSQDDSASKIETDLKSTDFSELDQAFEDAQTE